MGRATREKPLRLAEKLLQIRHAQGLSQSEMMQRLGMGNSSYRHYISAFENGSREPSLPMLLRYAQVANVWVDYLIDDALNLPDQLPNANRSNAKTPK